MYNDNLIRILIWRRFYCATCVCVNMDVKTSFAQLRDRFEKIGLIGLEREACIRINLCHRNKHQTESLPGKYQYFPRTARATNTHSIGYRWRTTVTLAFERDTWRASERDKDSGRRERKRELSERGVLRTMPFSSSYTKWRLRSHTRLALSFTRNTHVRTHCVHTHVRNEMARARILFTTSRIFRIFNRDRQCFVQNRCML